MFDIYVWPRVRVVFNNSDAHCPEMLHALLSSKQQLLHSVLYGEGEREREGEARNYSVTTLTTFQRILCAAVSSYCTRTIQQPKSSTEMRTKTTFIHWLIGVLIEFSILFSIYK